IKRLDSFVNENVDEGFLDYRVHDVADKGITFLTLAVQANDHIGDGVLLDSIDDAVTDIKIETAERGQDLIGGCRPADGFIQHLSFFGNLGVSFLIADNM